MTRKNPKVAKSKSSTVTEKKEMSWLWIILALLGVAAIIAGLLYEATLLFGDAFTQYDKMQYQGRYRDLADGCGGTNTTGCCMSSVDVMSAQHYNQTNLTAFPENEGCPAGFYKERLKCQGSYSWCEPEERGFFG